MKGSKIRFGEDLNGFLDRTTSLKGELQFADSMRIDGKVSGRIISDNVLVVGETAEIDADIDVAAISIMGKVWGTLRASAKVEVHAGGSFIGDVTTPSIRVDEGAIFQGRCDMNISVTTRSATPRLALVEDGPPGRK